MMNILILGSGGREHAFAWKLHQSRKVGKLFIAPGNAGTSQYGVNLPIETTDFENIRMSCIENNISMVVVGPELPLVEGIADYFKADPVLRHIALIGPDKAGATLEGSKAFAKAFMVKNNIPTAASFTVLPEKIEEGIEFLRGMNPASPYVLKADGLAAGKGVLILDKLDEAIKELQLMIAGKFGKASRQVVIEQFLDGIEVSVFVLTDGKNYKLLPSAKDYKRIGDGDTGLNTGGMGAVSPVIFADHRFMQKVEERIVKPTIAGLISEGIDYKGFIFIGLMNVDGDPFVIEYNVRLGDPEAECIIPRIKSDMVPLFEAVAKAELSAASLEIDDRSAITVVLTSGGYPGEFEKGKIISGLNTIKDCIVFQAGTGADVQSGGIKTTGGRVVAITSLDYSPEAARRKVYASVGNIAFDGLYYRKDIGLDLLSYKSR